jgi:branched-chain amino acid transport system permease protein
VFYYYLNQGVAGIAFGAIIALSATGVVLTYRATGVFNFAHGAVAMFVAYLYWQAVDVWHAPAIPIATLGTLVIGPALGLLLERFVFRPLQRRGAGTADQLVATLGVFVLLVGVATIIWGLGGKSGVTSVLPSTSYHLPHGILLPKDGLTLVVLVAVVATVIQIGFTRTRLGRQIRAVVDRRDLAELAAVDADRVNAISWAVGCGFAGLTGILLAPTFGLTTYNLTLVVVETFAAAAIARLSSLPRTVGAGLLLGVLSNELTGLQLHGHAKTVVTEIAPNVLTLALLVTLLVYRRLDIVGEQRASGTTLTVRTMGRRGHRSVGRIVAGLAVAATAAFGPLYLQGDDTRLAQQAVGLAIIFLSIVAITGYSGQISLGQSGFAGLGALVTVSLSEGAFFGGRAPVLVAMLVAVLLNVALGVVVGFPALRRRGLFLALTTLAVAEAIYSFVLSQSNTTSGIHGAPRPHLFGLSLQGDRAFYLFELVVLAGVLGLVRNLRSGRLGRALGAMRDSEDGAQAIGLSLRRYKLFIFAVSAGIAAIGGALYSQAGQGFDPQDYQPIQGLFFFVAVVVAGTGSAVGAVLAAAATVAIDAGLGAGTSTIFIGGLAVALGFLPGGLAVQARVQGRRMLDWLDRPAVEEPEPEPAYVLSGRGVAARERLSS